jgi:hypothetical protein
VDVVLSALRDVWPGSPGLLLLAVVLLLAAAQVGRRLFGSLQRQGERIGALEQGARATELRRYQVEATLLGLGVPLPPWPDGPHPRDVVDQVDRDQRPDEDDDLATTALATQHFSRHHLNRRNTP